MPFLSFNQQRQSIGENNVYGITCNKIMKVYHLLHVDDDSFSDTGGW